MERTKFVGSKLPEASSGEMYLASNTTIACKKKTKLQKATQPKIKIMENYEESLYIVLCCQKATRPVNIKENTREGEMKVSCKFTHSVANIFKLLLE